MFEKGLCKRYRIYPQLFIHHIWTALIGHSKHLIPLGSKKCCLWSDTNQGGFWIHSATMWLN